LKRRDKEVTSDKRELKSMDYPETNKAPEGRYVNSPGLQPGVKNERGKCRMHNITKRINISCGITT